MEQQKTMPQNQWSLCVWYLINYKTKGFTMKDACRDLFYKINSRLGEVERGRSEELKILRTPMTSTNRFGHTMNYTLYKSLASREYLLSLMNELNEKGSKALHK